jgi:class 3 adenylate cyclase
MTRTINFAALIQSIIKNSKEKLESGQEVTLNLMTVFLADLVGATAAKEEYGHSKGMKRCNIHNFIAEETVKRFNGKVVKFMGDAVLAVFYHNIDAVIAALAFREALEAVNLPGEEFRVPLETRIILTTGTVEEFNTEFGYDISGQVVDKAARLEKTASAGQILVEAGVIDQIRIMLERFPFIKIPGNIDISELQLKGVKDPVRVLEITTRDKPFGRPPSEEGQYIFNLIDAISKSKSRVSISIPVIENSKNRKDIAILYDNLLEAQNKRGVDVRILYSGCETAGLVAAVELEKLGLTVRCCKCPMEDSINLIDDDVVIFDFKKQNPASPKNKYLKMISLHINSALASDFEARWTNSIPPIEQLKRI